MSEYGRIIADKVKRYRERIPIGAYNYRRARALVIENRRLRHQPRFDEPVQHLMSLKRCTKCGLTYREYENIGRWKCFLHPGSYDTRRHRWTCCGRQESDTSGCTRADHVFYNADNLYSIPSAVFTLVPAEHVSREPTVGKVTLNRRTFLTKNVGVVSAHSETTLPKDSLLVICEEADLNKRIFGTFPVGGDVNVAGDTRTTYTSDEIPSIFVFPKKEHPRRIVVGDVHEIPVKLMREEQPLFRVPARLREASESDKKYQKSLEESRAVQGDDNFEVAAQKHTGGEFKQFYIVQRIAPFIDVSEDNRYQDAVGAFIGGQYNNTAYTRKRSLLRP